MKKISEDLNPKCDKISQDSYTNCDDIERRVADVAL